MNVNGTVKDSAGNPATGLTVDFVGSASRMWIAPPPEGSPPGTHPRTGTASKTTGLVSVPVSAGQFAATVPTPTLSLPENAEWNGVQPERYHATATVRSPTGVELAGKSQDAATPAFHFDFQYGLAPILFQLQTLHCTAEGDGPGNAEPYLWVVYFKLDADTLATGHVTVITRAGDHGDLLDSDVGAGKNVPIPPGLGALSTTLAPIALPDGTSFGGAVGCLAIAMEQDNTPDDAIVAGHQALDGAVRDGLDTLIPRLVAMKSLPSQADLDALSDAVKRAVTDALSAHVKWPQWVWGLGNMDDYIGTAVFFVTADQLAAAGQQPIELRAWWIEQSVAFADLRGQPLGSLRPGDYDHVYGPSFGIHLPRGWRVWLYPQPGQQGNSKLVVHNQLVAMSVRSVRIDMGSVYLFAGTDFAGRNVGFSEPGRYDADRLAPLAGAPVGSLQIPDGWRVTAYSEPHFTGRSVTLIDDTAALGGRLASLLVERAEATSGDGDYELRGHAMIVPPALRHIDAAFGSPPTGKGPETVTVLATDTVSHQPVAGRVLINGVDVAATNQPFAFEFHTRKTRHQIWLPPDEDNLGLVKGGRGADGEAVILKPRKIWVTTRVWLDNVSVQAAGFETVAIPLGSDDDGSS
jgi:hypothetical protein